MRKDLFWLVVIVIAGLVIRLINLDKSGGLWYDEATIYSIASQNGIDGMLSADSHRFLLFPLYYLIYNFWINLFGNSDFTIRLMSVFFDVLAIIAAYFVGKEFKDKQTGLIYALMYSINSSFIYYAQEAKFYSLTFFLINLLLLFWIKLIKNQNWVLYSLFSIILVLTYTSQILLCIILTIITIAYLKKNNSANNIYWTLAPLLLLGIVYKKYFSGNFDAVTYDNSFALLAIQNWFTPVLNGLQNNIANYHLFILNNLFNLGFWIFVIYPAAFIITGIVIALKNSYQKPILCIFITGVVYFLMHIILSNFSHYNALVRYTLPALPLFLLTAAYGISLIKNKLPIIIFIFINLIFLFSTSGAIHIPRPEGYRILSEKLINAHISDEADFILPIRKNLLDKYYEIKGKKYSLYDLNSYDAQKTYLTDEEIINLKTKQNQFLVRFLNDDKISKDFENYIQNNYIKSSQLIVLVDKSICLFSNEQLKTITKSKDFAKYPFQFLRLSKLNNDLITVLTKKMHLKEKIIYKTWEIYVFEI